MYLAGYRYVSYQVFINYLRATNNYPAGTNDQAGAKNNQKPSGNSARGAAKMATFADRKKTNGYT